MLEEHRALQRADTNPADINFDYSQYTDENRHDWCDDSWRNVLYVERDKRAYIFFFKRIVNFTSNFDIPFNCMVETPLYIQDKTTSSPQRGHTHEQSRTVMSIVICLHKLMLNRISSIKRRTSMKVLDV